MSYSKSQSALGFLTIQGTDDAGLIGGYLVLNPAGRPLEFHCTVPVKANRAQQILFGRTLEPFLYGEQIGQTLVNKGAVQPVAIYTDVEPALAVRDFIQVPVALLLGAAPPASADADSAELAARYSTNSEASAQRGDSAERRSRLATFSLGKNRLAVCESWRRDQDEIQQRFAASADFDLAEPFERIREAIVEAHKQSRG